METDIAAEEIKKDKSTIIDNVLKDLDELEDETVLAAGQLTALARDMAARAETYERIKDAILLICSK